MKKAETFLIRSQRMVPLFFYVAVPLFLRKSGIPAGWILVPTAMLLLGYWLVRRKIYLEKETVGRLALDALGMAAGLAALYWIELRFYAGTDTLNLLLYVLAFLSYAPTLLTTSRLRRAPSA